MSSNRNRKTLLAAVIAVIVAAGLIAGVIFVPGLVVSHTTSTSSSSTTSSIQTSSAAATGTLGVQLTDPPALPPGVTNDYINYSGIFVHVADAGNSSGWYQIAPAGEIDLMSVLNTSITLGSANVSTGLYNALGFNVTSATVTANGVNQTAFLSSNHLIVPLVPRIQVNASASEGVLIDLSPTVLAVQNGSQTEYVMIPSAEAFHMPAVAWFLVEHKGDVIRAIQQAAWFIKEAQGHIALSNLALTNDSMSVTVTNTGQNSTFISTLHVYYPLASFCTEFSGSCPVNPVGDDLPKAVPVAMFGVLSNGSLVQFNYTASAIATSSGVAAAQLQTKISLAEQQGIGLGYLLAPGQSVTLTFSGKIATINADILDYIHLTVAVPSTLANSVSNINSGQQYYIVARGPFLTFAYASVNAT